VQKTTLFLFLLRFSFQAFGQTYFPFKKDGKWGVYDKTTQKSYTTPFDSIAPFSQHYNRDFNSVDPFAVAYTEPFAKVINFEGKVLLDSLLDAAPVTSHDHELVLKANLVLNIFKFSKRDKELYGFFDPKNERVLVPDKYSQVNFFFSPSDEKGFYYYGYDPQEKRLEIFDVGENKLRKSIPCETYDFDSKNTYGDVPKELFLLIHSQGQTAILNAKGEEIIAPGAYQDIDFSAETITLDRQVFDLEGNLLGEKQQIDEEMDGYEADSEEIFLVDQETTCELMDLGGNSFSLQGSNDLTFQLDQTWSKIALLDIEKRKCDQVSYLSFSVRDKMGVYNFREEKLVLKPQYKSIIPFYFGVNTNYKQYTSLPAARYGKTRSLTLFSVKNKDNSYNIFNPNTQAFIFKKESQAISLLQNYDFISFATYLLVAQDSYAQLYDVNGTLLLDQIAYLSIRNSQSKSDETDHQMLIYKNNMHLDRYFYVRFTHGDSGYFFIDNSTWKLHYLFPTK